MRQFGGFVNLWAASGFVGDLLYDDTFQGAFRLFGLDLFERAKRCDFFSSFIVPFLVFRVRRAALVEVLLDAGVHIGVARVWIDHNLPRIAADPPSVFIREYVFQSLGDVTA